MLKLNTFASRIAFGFIIVTAILGIAVSLTLWRVNETAQISATVNNVRVPLARQSLSLLNSLNHSLAVMRAWILTGEEKYKLERQEAIVEINNAFGALEKIYTHTNDNQDLQKINSLNSKVLNIIDQQNKAIELYVRNKEEALEILSQKTVPLSYEVRNIIESMVGQQDQLLAAEIKEVEGVISTLKLTLWILLFIGVFAAGLTGLLVTRDVTKPLVSAVEASERIANEDFDFEVNFEGPEEFGYLKSSLEKMRSNLKNLMSGLREKNQELESKQWLIDGQVGLLEIMGGDQSIKILAGNVLQFLAPKVDALMGVFYLVDGEKIQAIEGYAHYDNNLFSTSLRMNEGLVGQVAYENKTCVVNDVPENYFRIKSGLGQMLPKTLILVPISFDNQVVGVLEFALHEEVSHQTLELLEQSIQNIGIAINLSISNQQTKELLEETQVQAEELQAQQEELRAANEELEAKTTSLEASEEELRSQQEELRMTNEELEEQTLLLEQEKSALSDRTYELEEVRTALEVRAKEMEQVSRYKSEFLANMSHELRTPLNSILMLSQTLGENRTDNLSSKQIQAVNTIYSSGNDLLDLIEDILDLSKVEAGKLDVKPEDVSIAELVESMENSFLPMAKDRGLRFNIEMAENLPTTMFTDSTRLKQILKNLLSNAFKFTNEGSVSLTVYKTQVEQAPHVGFSVKDTGIGIPTADKQSVFDAFKQLDAKTTRKYGGTGLGLSIVKELVNLLEAKISLESVEGEGTTVNVTFPEKFIGAKTITEKPIEEVQENKVLKLNRSISSVSQPVNDDRESISVADSVVLIVEDDFNFANSLLDMCRDNGFKGVIINDGVTAVKLAEEIMPKGILLDLSLPELDGTSVLKLIKANPKTRHIPVQVITGHDRQFEVLKNGALGFLKKPATNKDLENVFKKMSEISANKDKYVLIVEDNEAQRQGIREYIELPGIKVLEADTGAKGLELLSQHEVGCIILDLKLPDFSGKEFLQKAKNEYGSDGIPPVIIYTGKDLNDDEIREFELLSKSIIVKGAKSPERLFDETMMFLHRLQKDLPTEKKKIVENLHDPTRILSGKKILVVDDDNRNIISLKHLLEDHGVLVLEAENGKKALDVLASRNDIDLVLMDMMMPEMDGYEATRQIRKHIKYNSLPVVALTARAMKGEREKCLEAGCNDYLSKPVQNDKLLSLLRVWLYKAA